MITIAVGDELLAHVWSFSSDLAEDPYMIVLKPGAKPRKICTCPRFIYSGSKTCKHLATLRQKVKDGTILQDDRYKLTDFGKEYFKLS